MGFGPLLRNPLGIGARFHRALQYAVSQVWRLRATLLQGAKNPPLGKAMVLLRKRNPYRFW
jgi:hypothetical protein